MEMFGVDIRLAVKGDPPSIQALKRRSSVKHAIDAVVREIRRRKGRKEFIELLPVAVVHAEWTVRRGHIPIRCLCMYAPFPADGGPPCWMVRVDVGYERLR